MVDCMQLAGDLSLEQRGAFLGRVNANVDRAAAQSQRHVVVDCSIPERLDDVTMAMLVVAARSAQRHGLRVQLAAVSPTVRRDLEELGVAAMFDYESTERPPTGPS